MIQWGIVVILLGVIVSYFFSMNAERYQKIEYKIEYPSDTLFLQSDLAAYIDRSCPRILGRLIDSVNLTAFERQVEKYPYLESADVINARGTLMIKAVQHKILGRVYNQHNEQFYIAQNGKLVPFNSCSPGRVVIVNGYISDKYSPKTHLATIDTKNKKWHTPPPLSAHSTLYAIWKILQYIDRDDFWRAEIGQIYVNSKQEICLAPIVGNHIVTFGRLDLYQMPEEDIKTRFNHLKDVYQQGFPLKGWDTYDYINLSFGTEVPCRQRKENRNQQ
jgi:cell division protein FtsQ